jgi:secondary thiamine-phosphate synthase enzyme
MERIEVATRSRTQAIDITGQVQEVVSRSATKSGIVAVFSAHTTAGVTINENADPDVMSDVMEALARLVPRSGPYAHVEGNSDAHAKSGLVGHSVLVPVEDGKLELGTWQGIYFCEFDGPRRRQVVVQVLAAG